MTATELNFVDCDWLATPTGNMLHHATDLAAYQLKELEDNGTLLESKTLDCGRTVRYVWIPGFISRLGRERCVRCCKKNGLPPGVGSPKNDKECRRILGMDS